MSTVFQTQSCRRTPLKIGLALALLGGQGFAQPAANGLVPPPEASTQASGQPDAADGPVIVSTDKAKDPKAKHQVKLGKVKPDQYTSKPQQAVKALR